MLPKQAQVSLIFIYGIIAIFGTFSNTVSMLCLWKQWKSKPRVSNSQKILMSLIVSDLLMSTVSCPIQITNFFVYIPTHGYVMTSLIGVSSLTILLMALDKFLKLTRFSVYHDMVSDERLMVAISFCWIVPIALMTSTWWNTVFFGLFNGLLTLVTLFALPVFYIRIYRFYKRSKRNVAKFSERPHASTATKNESHVYAQPPTTSRDSGPTNQDGSKNQDAPVKGVAGVINSNQKNQRKLTTKILKLISAYFICTIIYSVIAFLASFRIISHSTLFYLALAIYHANSIMNPIIYVFSDAQFQRTVKYMFGINTRSNAVSNTVAENQIKSRR